MKDQRLFETKDTWENGTISINVDGLIAGQYSFILTLTDIEGNSVQDEVIVIVTPTDTSGTSTDTSTTSDTPGFESLWIILSLFTFIPIRRLKSERKLTMY